MAIEPLLLKALPRSCAKTVTISCSTALACRQDARISKGNEAEATKPIVEETTERDDDGVGRQIAAVSAQEGHGDIIPIPGGGGISDDELAHGDGGFIASNTPPS